MAITGHNKYANDVCANCHNKAHKKYHSCLNPCNEALVSAPQKTGFSRFMSVLETIFIQLVSFTTPR